MDSFFVALPENISSSVPRAFIFRQENLSTSLLTL